MVRTTPEGTYHGHRDQGIVETCVLRNLQASPYPSEEDEHCDGVEDHDQNGQAPTPQLGVDVVGCGP